MHALGQGMPHNAFEAAEWLARAASAGHTEAESEYATALFRGHGVPVDEARGAQLFLRAARKGNPVAQNRLARCLAHGRGVAKDLKEAAKWHAIAVAGGITDPALDKLVAKLGRADRRAAEVAAADWLEEHAAR